jgi:hypothetical protein
MIIPALDGSLRKPSGGGGGGGGGTVTGGTVTTPGDGYTYHTFTTSGTYTA